MLPGPGPWGARATSAAQTLEQPALLLRLWWLASAGNSTSLCLQRQ